MCWTIRAISPGIEYTKVLPHFAAAEDQERMEHSSTLQCTFALVEPYRMCGVCDPVEVTLCSKMYWETIRKTVSEIRRNKHPIDASHAVAIGSHTEIMLAQSSE